MTLLRETAENERAGERAVARLADVAALFSSDLAQVEAVLGAAARDGARPATDAAVHLLEAGGKRVRPLTTLLAASCFGGITPAVRELAAVAELVHLATLLHDDVIDDGMERRGRPTSRRVWGNAVSVLSGDLLLTHALERTAVAAPERLGDLVGTLRRLVDGEVVQLRGRSRLDVDEVTYFRIVNDKTASLFGWAARAGARTAGADARAAERLGDFGERLGVAFQLVDDCLDYAGEPEATGKSLLADLREGKLTLPLLRAIAKGAVSRGALERARERENEGEGGGEAAATELARSVCASGACDEVRRLARAETERALAALEEAAAPCEARELLRCVALELTARVR